MYIQEKDNVFDIEWVNNITYGDIFKEAEVEHSVYSFEEADIDLLFSLFDSYEKEAKRVIDKNIILPAYDYVLKCSHVFNVLDSRGAISVTERTGFISRVRNLAKMVAQSYLRQREEMQFPLLKKFENIY